MHSPTHTFCFYTLLGYFLCLVRFCTANQSISTAPISSAPEGSISGSLAKASKLTQVEARLTNAQRLARGLPLKPPVRRASRVVAAARGLTSGIPETTLSGRLVARHVTNGTVFGYISSTTIGAGAYTLSATPEGSLEVAVDLATLSLRDWNIGTVNGPFADYPFFGSVSGAVINRNEPFGPDSGNYAYLAPTIRTLPGQPGVPGGGASSIHVDPRWGPNVVASAIWRYHPSSNSFTGTYVNTDGSIVAMNIGYDMGVNIFVLIGNLEKYRSSFHVEAPALTLHFEPLV